MSKTPRIIDIAQLANVSIGTVDRVLNNRGRVASKTREKVLKIASDLGYQRNIHASALAVGKKTQHVCSLIPRHGMDPFWDQVHVGFERAAGQVQMHNIQIHAENFDLFSPTDFRTKLKSLEMGKYDGLVVAPVFLREWPRLNEILEINRVPHVMINTLTKVQNPFFLSYIGPDSYQSGRLAARLLSLHCSPGDRVMMIPLEIDFRNAHHMLEKERGFRDCFADLAADVEVVTQEFEDYDDPEALGQFITETLSLHSNLKGIYTSASRIHKIAAHFFYERIDHVRLVGYDSLEQNMIYLKGGKIDYLINQNPALMGYLGLVNLSKYLIFKSRPERMVYLPLDVILPENVAYYQNHYLMQDQIFTPIR